MSVVCREVRRIGVFLWVLFGAEKEEVFAERELAKDVFNTGKRASEEQKAHWKQMSPIVIIQKSGELKHQSRRPARPPIGPLSTPADTFSACFLDMASFIGPQKRFAGIPCNPWPQKTDVPSAESAVFAISIEEALSKLSTMDNSTRRNPSRQGESRSGGNSSG